MATVESEFGIGITAQTKQDVVAALDEILDFAKRARSVVPALSNDALGARDVRVPCYYQGLRPQADRIAFRHALDEEDIRRQNELAHWLNQNILIRVFAVLDAFNVRRLLRPESRHVAFLCELRQEFAHGHGTLKPSMLAWYAELFPHVDTSVSTAGGDFCLPFDEVIQPLILKIREAVERMPLAGESSIEALRAELRKRIGERPFRPFRLELTNGHLDVSHAEMNLVADSYIVVGQPAPDEPNSPFYDQTQTVPLSQIISVSSVAPNALSP